MPKQTFDKVTDSRLLNTLVLNAVENCGFVNSTIDSLNVFYKIGISEILQSNFNNIRVEMENIRTETEADRAIKTISVKMNIKNNEISKPNINTLSSTNVKLYPSLAEEAQLTYSGILKTDIEVISTAYNHDGTTQENIAEISDCKIAQLPIMVGSEFCNTYGKTRSELIRFGEDVQNPGGSFIIRGINWSILHREDHRYNFPYIFNNLGHKNEHIRLEFLSKAGDSFENSSELKIRILTTGKEITLEITSVDFRGVQLPFYSLLRALGAPNDKYIVEHIVMSMNATHARAMMPEIKRAFNTAYTGFTTSASEYGQFDVIKYIITSISGEGKGFRIDDTKENLHYNTNKFLRIMDEQLLPHIGTTSDNRINKVDYICYLIYKMLLVKLDIIRQTDRDDYTNKKITSPGDGLGKYFKNIFNLVFIAIFKKEIINAYRNNSFGAVDVRRAVRTAATNSMSKITKDINKIITTGKGKKHTMYGKELAPSKMTTQRIEHKNTISIFATAMLIRNSYGTTAQKRSQREFDRRMVHPSGIGVCPFHTNDTGEDVGTKKQLAITAIVSPSNSGILLYQQLFDDPLMFSMTTPLEQVYNERLYRVLVNGVPVGFVADGVKYAEELRFRRRRGELNSQYVSVYCNTVCARNSYFK